jgi:predicted DsbA family dithiol-disulfide isomerase
MRIDVWSDVACPWCYVGKRNLELALEELGLTPEITWRAFELDPTAPKSTSLSMDEVLSRKYGTTIEQAQEMNRQMTTTAAKLGLEYHLDTLQLGNSFDAHRLAKLAEDHDLGEEIAERLFAAYFTESQLISDHETLTRLGVEVGLDEAEIRRVLASDAYSDEVRGDEAMAQEAGFTGVPTFVIDGQFAIPGAQPVETMVRLLGKLAAKDPSDFTVSDG